MRLADHIPSLELRVTKTYNKSYLSLIAQNINQAHEEKAPIELFADKVLYYFIPGLLAIALVSGVVISTLFTPALAVQCVIAVLVSACPCALSLITPMAVKIGMKKAAENGIHFNNGKALQAAADIDTVVFDLNGTLTKGKIVVTSLKISNKKWLPYVALLEGQSEHPVAKVIQAHLQAKNTFVSDSLTAEDIDKSNHSGIKGKIGGESFIVGNIDMLIAHGISSIATPYDDPHNGSIYIVKDQTVIGQIALTDPLRDDAKATISQLKALGKKVHLCTGADKVTAEAYANHLGIDIDNVCANAMGASSSPSEVSKTSYIQQLQKRGLKVAMVGDAANDLTAIAYSDLGIAVKSSIGDSITQQHAGVVLQQGLLFPIVTAFDVAKKTKSNIKQNLVISLAYNSTSTLIASGLLIGVGFTLNPALGVALVVVESALVLANLYRFKQQEPISAVNAKKTGIDFPSSESTPAKLLYALEYFTKPQSAMKYDQELDRTPYSSPYSLFSPSVCSQKTVSSTSSPEIEFSGESARCGG
jgi:Cu2+-exporting ATPase